MTDAPTYKNVKFDFDITGLNEYTQQSITTESPVTNVTVNNSLLAAALQIHIASGNILDQIKKHIFYGSDYNLEKYEYTLTDLFVQVVGGLERMKDYIESPDVAETTLPLTQQQVRVLHSILGLCTESTELAEAWRKFNETGELDLVNLIEETGDCGWYMAILHDAVDADMGQTLYTNAQKLAFRFNKGKFTMEDAEVRNLSGEREILEGE